MLPNGLETRLLMLTDDYKRREKNGRKRTPSPPQESERRVFDFAQKETVNLYTNLCQEDEVLGREKPVQKRP